MTRQSSKLSITYRHVEQQRQSILSIHARMARVNSKGIFDIGQQLCEASEILSQLGLKNNGDGVFWKWIKEEFDGSFSRQTAWKRMTVYEHFKDRKPCLRCFTPSSLYLLSQPATPESARRKAHDWATKHPDRLFTHAKVKQLIDTVKDEGSPSPDTDAIGPSAGIPPMSPLDRLLGAWLDLQHARNRMKKAWKKAPPETRRKFKQHRKSFPYAAA